MAAASTGEVAQLMGFGAFGDKTAQFRQYKTSLGLKEAIAATRRDKKCAPATHPPHRPLQLPRAGQHGGRRRGGRREEARDGRAGAQACNRGPGG